MNKRTVRQKLKSAIKRLGASGNVPSKNIPATFSVDSPVKPIVKDKTILVEGWIIPKTGHDLKKLTVKNGNSKKEISINLQRPDVARAFPNLDGALKSGFSAEVTPVTGLLSLEADFGNGLVEIYKLNIKVSAEQLVSDLYNPNLATNWAEHQNLLDAKKVYFHEKEQTKSYIQNSNDPRLVAFYLPQFYPFAENDKAWGKGFTEWTNVTSDSASFIGHRQPILPSDLGYYDLRYEQNIKQQIDLAKQHGIYGFCIYYYWFSGQRLLEKPLDSILKHKQWDFNFTICWANENWTKRWDGRDSEVIIAQKYKDDDPVNFIKDVEPILLDPRYITENGKPVLVVYRASELKEPAKYVKVWRQYFLEKHNIELHLVSCLSFDDKDPREYGFDAALDFAPQSIFFKNSCFEDGQYPYVDINNQLIDPNFEGQVANYRTIALNKKINNYFAFPTYRSVTPSWDNDARKKGKGFVMFYENPDIYGRWLQNVIEQESKSTKSPLIFINSWNEWAEGAQIEPTMHYGNAVLNRTTEVLSLFSKEKINKTNFPLYDLKRGNTKVAVVIHLYYPERWEYLNEKLKDLGSIKYDLFITITQKDSEFVKEIYKDRPNANIYLVPNRGRDVLPFIHICRRLKEVGYEFVLKLHSKKSTHIEDGNEWFTDVVSKLIPSEKLASEAIKKLESSETNMVGPESHLVSSIRHMGSNKEQIEQLLKSIYSQEEVSEVMSNLEKYPYFAGTMFWASIKGLSPILDLYLMPEDFQSETGQIDGTMAHALERLFGIICRLEKKNMYEVDSRSIKLIAKNAVVDKYKYAP